MAINSILFLLASGLTLFLTLRLNNYLVWNLNIDSMDAGIVDQTEKAKSGFYYGTIILCCLTVLLGIMGLMLIRYHNYCSLGIFGSLSLIISIIFLAVGVSLIVLRTGATSFIDQYCYNNGQYDQLSSTIGKYNLNYLADMDKKTVSLINTYMCSATCPCVAVNNQKYGTSLQNSDRQLVFNGNYATFYQCYQNLISTNKISSNQQLSQGQLDVIKTLETEDQCQNLCKPSKFAFYSDIRGGPIENSCREVISSMYDKSIGLVGLGSILTGLLVFMAFNVQYGFWSRKNRRQSEANDEEHPVIVEADSFEDKDQKTDDYIVDRRKRNQFK